MEVDILILGETCKYFMSIGFIDSAFTAFRRNNFILYDDIKRAYKLRSISIALFCLQQHRSDAQQLS